MVYRHTVIVTSGFILQSQAQECVYEQLILSNGKPVKFTDHIKYAQEAAMVSQMYEETHNAVASKAIRNDVPASWLTITIMKCNHYMAMAHYYLASALTLSKGDYTGRLPCRSSISTMTSNY